MKAATLITAVLSLLAIGVLLVLSELPVFPVWTGPAHFSSSLVLAFALAALVAIWCSRTYLETAWLTLVSGSALVVLLELLQLVNPVRQFQLEDILFGVAGISAGAIITYYLLLFLGNKKFAMLSMAGAAAVGIFLFHFSTRGMPAAGLSCGIKAPAASEWDAVLLSDFTHNNGVASNGKLEFCVAADVIVATNGTSYSADLRVSLHGLAQAVKEKTTFVMGIQFESAQKNAFSEIISLTWSGTANRYFARLYRSGTHLMAMLQYNGGERTMSSLANRIERGTVHELVMVYDGTQQTTWLNGRVVSSEVNQLNPPANENFELVLNIRQIADRRSWVRFEGDIKAIYLGTQVIGEADIQSIFSE